MQKKATRRWLTATLLTVVTLLSMPLSAADPARDERGPALEGWWNVAWTYALALLDWQALGDETDNPPHMDPNGGLVAASPPTPAANEGLLTGVR